MEIILKYPILQYKITTIMIHKNIDEHTQF